MRTNWVKSNTPVSDLDVMTQWTAPTEGQTIGITTIVLEVVMVVVVVVVVDR